MWRRSKGISRRAMVAGVASVVSAVFLAVAAPAFAQGLATVEPTLDECRSFVETNGVPETRPVWENRGYSGWDVCLNMAYDGDMEGSFTATDANGNGRLDAAEQSAYMDSVIGSVSDPDQSPLTLAKCAAMVAEYGIPAERPFVDWSNRGYGDAEVCQSLAFDGTLDTSFATADANADGRLDRAEQSSYISSLTAVAPNGASTEAPEISRAQDESVVAGAEGAAQNQYDNAETGNTVAGDAGTGDAGTGNAGAEETVAPEAAPAEPTISAVSDGAATEQPDDSQETARTDETTEPETGVLSAVSEVVEELLPETGGIPILGILGGAALIIGGFIAYRLFR